MPELTKTLDYTKRVFTFLDILGFGKLVERSAHDKAARALLSQFVDADRVFSEFMNMMQLGTPSFFSDSILLSMAKPEHSTLYMIREIGMLARYLLFMGFATRGGITVGAVHHEGNVVVGPAMISAYKLEQRANYPRVILDESAMEYWSDEFRPDCAHPELQGWVKRDCDGEWFIDIFSPLWAHALPMGVIMDAAHLIPDTSAEFNKAVLPHIAKGCADTDPRVRAKWQWLASQCKASNG